MPLHLQARLLCVLAEGQVMPLGALQAVDVDVRVLAATHCNLARLIKEGAFQRRFIFIDLMALH